MDSFFSFLSYLKALNNIPLEIHEIDGRLIIYVATNKNIENDLAQQLNEILIILCENPSFIIKFPNFITQKTLYLLNQSSFDVKTTKFGVTVMIRLKGHIFNHLKALCQTFNIQHINNITNLIAKISEEANYKINKWSIFKDRAVKKLNSFRKIHNIFLVGQFNKEFIILHSDSTIIILDQHAIHERIRYEAILSKNKFDIDKCKNIACKGAIRFGDKLDHIKMERIIGELLKCKYPLICAHGRSSTAYINYNNINK